MVDEPNLEKCDKKECGDSLTKKKKPIITKTYDTNSNLKTSSSPFNPNLFEKAIFEKGYSVELERALRCPCIIRSNGNALSDCKNCGGLSWFFVDKIKTKMLFSGMGSKKKFAEWSEENLGTASISSPANDRLAYMDRITLICAEAFFSQVVYFDRAEGKMFAFLAYTPIEVDRIYMFDKSNTPLKILREGDYSIEYNILFLNIDKFDINNYKDYSVSIRYKHRPQYHVIDINRDIISTPVITTGSLTAVDTLMPTNAVARKAHYVLDMLNFYGQGLFDNTDYSQQENTCHQ